METTEKVTGLMGRELTRLITLYDDITGKLDDLKAAREQVVKEIKLIADHAGTFETREYILKINSRKGNDKFDKEGLKKKYLSIFEEFNTPYTGEPILTMGNIIEKGKRCKQEV